MRGRVQKFMRDIKEGLIRIYGDELKAVVLYGSYARGNARRVLDIDVMIVLKG